MITYRGGGLTTICLKPEDLAGQISRRPVQAEPIDVDRRVRRSRNVSRLSTDDKSIGMAGQACGREVPLGGEGSTSSVRDEVMLSENVGSMKLTQSPDDLSRCPGLGCNLPCFEGQFGNRLE